MKICFFNKAFVFNTETPFIQPLGGTESALCYLAIAFHKAGHQITLLSQNSSPGVCRGVRCLDLSEGTRDFFHSQRFDVLVVSNYAAGSVHFRALLPPQTRLLLWSEHDKNQPAMQALGQRDISNAWDLIVLISDYQRTGFINHFHLQPNQCVILRNAIGPHFESLYRDFAELESAKRQPILAYNSTPFRGLSLLPLIFRQFHQAHPETRLQVYSSMKVYQQEEPAEFEALYQTLKQTSGIEYVGSLPQPQLAQALKSSLILTYPNIFAETSCIAVMEAMAAGAFILSSEYGALPETTAGFGELVPVAFTSPEKYVGKFYHALESIYQRALTRREEFLQNLWNQVLHINQNDTWRVRADQWVAMLARELPLK